MSKNNGPGKTSVLNAHETNRNEELGIRTLTQEEVNEQIRSFIALLQSQLEDLI